MDLLSILSQYTPQILLVLSVLTLASLIMCLRLMRTLSALQKRWHSVLEGTRGENLERLLYDHLRERMVLQEDVAATKERVSVLEEKVESSKRHLGVVRYDAFEDVGGSQSFALALFDDRGDGAIVTSLVGRADCRVYCKTLTRGRSERSLSQEEMRAVKDAESNGPRPIISS